MHKDISNLSKIPVVVIAASFVIVITGLIQAISIVNPILMALFISIICAQPILWLQTKKVPQTLAVFIVLFLIVAIFIGFSELIGASLSSFSENASVYEDNLRAMVKTVVEFTNSLGLNISFTKVSSMFDVSKVMNLTASMLGQLGSIMGNVLTIFFLALFLLFELDSLEIKSKLVFKEATTRKYIFSIFKSIRHYLSIKTVTSLITGVFVWIALEITGLDYAIIWGLIAFLLNYIPNIGSIVAAIPAVLFALIQLGFVGVLWTSSIFIAVNMIVGNIIEPKMMGSGLGLSTYVVFVSLLVWGFILGTVGMFLSVPLTMAIKIMLEQNKRTEWIAILLGSREEAITILENENQ
ncbi:Predicted PurR-regulated permease PerM [Lutibacter agarilyticus]|uniref:Predicted PurR-regulated permease PerM n=1 Tax=Lutibacter agarilyticus TaxID=1109740 RepID=A0A238VJQ2_9FLAO|nr:AI-2E family transporter [Lutibacter agarilyticus]SNR33729.1 Predicted PurR-regulated permease PerM [Lutibacter agarilyticus]